MLIEASSVEVNPFAELTDRLRRLRRDFMSEARPMRQGERFSENVAEIVGCIAGLINDCEDMTRMLESLERTDPDTFAAFRRALEKT